MERLRKRPAASASRLRHAEKAPQLPSGYATMMLIAMIPPLWRRIMDWRVVHYGGQQHLAALGPRYAERRRRSIHRDASPPL